MNYMSRSYKKYPLCKIGDKKLKKLYNRKLRRRKQLDYPSGNKYRREPGNNSWEICDYRGGYFPGQQINDPRLYWYYMK